MTRKEELHILIPALARDIVKESDKLKVTTQFHTLVSLCKRIEFLSKSLQEAHTELEKL
jgi:hypothetical protein